MSYDFAFSGWALPASVRIAQVTFLLLQIPTMKHVWLDCDPVCLVVLLCHLFEICSHQGHDDATAILLAIHSLNIHLLGVSTVRYPCYIYLHIQCSSS
jgi:hypothetical protein